VGEGVREAMAMENRLNKLERHNRVGILTRDPSLLGERKRPHSQRNCMTSSCNSGLVMGSIRLGNDEQGY
jgi:hypothetical protein